jgi:hypothetical protein
MYFRARYYSPLAGRFISADSIVPEAGNPQALNRYSYALNDPLRYIDPSGHGYCDSPYAFAEDCAEAGKGVGKPPKPPTPPPPSSPGSPLIHPEPPSWFPDLGEALAQTSVTLDKVSFVVSGVGVVVTWGTTLGGAAVGAFACSPGFVAALGCAAEGAIEGKLFGEEVWNASPFNQIENRLGVASAILTTASDLYLGNSGVDPITGELVVGENTLRAWGTALFGYIPSSDIDLAVNAVQVHWDLNGTPGQLRIGGSFPWFRWKSP